MFKNIVLVCLTIVSLSVSASEVYYLDVPSSYPSQTPTVPSPVVQSSSPTTEQRQQATSIVQTTTIASFVTGTNMTQIFNSPAAKTKDDRRIATCK